MEKKKLHKRKFESRLWSPLAMSMMDHNDTKIPYLKLHQYLHSGSSSLMAEKYQKKKKKDRDAPHI